MVPIDLSQETLGELVHAQRSSVDRALRRLRQERLIARHPDGWSLLDPAGVGLEDDLVSPLDHGGDRHHDREQRFARPARVTPSTHLARRAGPMSSTLAATRRSTPSGQEATGSRFVRTEATGLHSFDPATGALHDKDL